MALHWKRSFQRSPKAVSKLKLRSTILDGEVVAVDENGIPRFQLLQRFQKQPTAPTLYYVFDVLWSDGDDITGKTTMERRAVLDRIIKRAPGIQLGSYVEGEGKALFALVKEKGMEGIIAKRKDSIYRPGKRTSDWLKIKARLQQEFVVGGLILHRSRLYPRRQGTCGLQERAKELLSMNTLDIFKRPGDPTPARAQIHSTMDLPVQRLSARW